jgi:hypothetical protein
MGKADVLSVHHHFDGELVVRVIGLEDQLGGALIAVLTLRRALAHLDWAGW